MPSVLCAAPLPGAQALPQEAAVAPPGTGARFAALHSLAAPQRPRCQRRGRGRSPSAADTRPWPPPRGDAAGGPRPTREAPQKLKHRPRPSAFNDNIRRNWTELTKTNSSLTTETPRPVSLEHARPDPAPPGAPPEAAGPPRGRRRAGRGRAPGFKRPQGMRAATGAGGG